MQREPKNVMKFQHTPLQNLQVNGAISGTVCNVMDLSG